MVEGLEGKWGELGLLKGGEVEWVKGECEWDGFDFVLGI